MIATSNKSDGNMSYKLGPKKQVDDNHRLFFDKHDIRPGRVVTMEQVHGDRIGVVKRPQVRKHTDGLITKTPNLWLAVYHADCIPLFFVDETIPTVGIAHVGWRGTVAQLPVKMVREMGKHFKSKPENIEVYFGPFICADHYDVDLGDKRLKLLPHKIKNGKGYIDLYQAVKTQLKSSGIHDSIECTAEQPDKYWSYHQTREKLDGVMISVIGFSG
jgi:YfiH family protein